ncbi:unnamed protein product, partial [Sphacelaria rigidula]
MKTPKANVRNPPAEKSSRNGKNEGENFVGEKKRRDRLKKCLAKTTEKRGKPRDNRHRVLVPTAKNTIASRRVAWDGLSQMNARFRRRCMDDTVVPNVDSCGRTNHHSNVEFGTSIHRQVIRHRAGRLVQCSNPLGAHHVPHASRGHYPASKQTYQSPLPPKELYTILQGDVTVPPAPRHR